MIDLFWERMLFPRFDWFLCNVSHVPVDMIKFIFLYNFINFLRPKTSKQVFLLQDTGRIHWKLKSCRLAVKLLYFLSPHSNQKLIKACYLLFNKVLKIWNLSWGLKSIFIHNWRYQRSHHGDWKLLIWWSGPVKSSAFHRPGRTQCSWKWSLITLRYLGNTVTSLLRPLFWPPSTQKPP